MKSEVSIKLCTVMAMMLLLSACAAPPKTSTWSSPNTVTQEQVFNAAMIAGTDNGFTIYNQDRSAGLISLKKEEYGGKKMVDRRMSVKIKPVGDKTMVSTKISGSDFGIIEGALGGAVHKELTKNFYIYLFRELKITDPTLKSITFEDAH
jgi:hypothetical protein